MKGGRFAFISFRILLAPLAHNSDPTKVHKTDPIIFGLFKYLNGNEEISCDDYTYGIMAMIRYCAQTNRLNLAFSFLGRLLKQGHRAEAVMFNPILKRLYSENRISDAVAIVIDKMPKLGCIPDVGTYNTLIDGLCKRGEIAKANEVLNSMISKGLEPDFVTYSSLVHGLCRKGELEKADEVLHSMIFKGLKPNVVTCNTLIHGLCNKGEIDKAEEVLDSMISKEIEPNVTTYNNLINGLCNKGEIDNAEKMLHDMPSKGLQPNLCTYLLSSYIRRVVPDRCEKHKAKELVLDLISIWRGNNGWTYNDIIVWLCGEGKIDMAKVLLDGMICRGKEPNAVTYDTLIDGFCKKGKIAKAKEVLHSMISKGLEPNVVTHNTLIDGLGKKGGMDEAN